MPQQAYLVTTVCHDRTPLFGTPDVAQAVAAVLQSDQCWPSAEVYGWVLMPDHWHGLIHIEGQESLGTVVQRAKSLMTKSIRSQGTAPERIWQKGFHDHALRRDEAVSDVLRYLLANPVRAGLVEHWHQGPHRGGSMDSRLSADATLW